MTKNIPTLTPQGIPRGLIWALVLVNVLFGLSGFRLGKGDIWQGFLHTLENWLVMLVFIPACTALLAMPIKYRDPEFDIKMAYYLGMFVSLLFMMGKLRYWR